MENALPPSPPGAVTLIALALAKAQSKFKLPEKNRTVEVPTKSGGKYTFDYADYTAIVEAVRGPLAENEIAFTHFLVRDERGLVLKTQLIHSSGQVLESIWPLRPSQDPKDIGGDMTYGKRYSLSALTGCVADDDVDVAPGTTESFKPKPPKTAPTPKPRETVTQVAERFHPPGGSPTIVKPNETATPPPSAASNTPTVPKGLSDKQRALLFARAGERGWLADQIKDHIERTWGITSTSDLTPEQFQQLLHTIETRTYGESLLKSAPGIGLDFASSP